jgi:hypothetical protein
VSIPPISTTEDLVHYSVAEYIARTIEGAVRDITAAPIQQSASTLFRSLVDSVIRNAGAKLKVLLVMLIYIRRAKQCIPLARNEFSYVCREVSSLDPMFIGALVLAQRVRSPIYPKSSKVSDYIPHSSPIELDTATKRGLTPQNIPRAR